MVEFMTQRDRYQGPDRRRGDRRRHHDRREEIRFEPGKEDRRCGLDRRKAGSWDRGGLR